MNRKLTLLLFGMLALTAVAYAQVRARRAGGDAGVFVGARARPRPRRAPQTIPPLSRRRPQTGRK